MNDIVLLSAQTPKAPSPAASPSRVMIDRGVPIPPVDRGRVGSNKKNRWLPWREMEVGDSFVFPGDVPRAAAAASEAAKRVKASFTLRTLIENGARVVRVWRVA